jgi:hypothetical protein
MANVPNSDPNLLRFRRFGLDDSASDEIVRHDPFFNRGPRPPSFSRPRIDDSALDEVGVVEGPKSYSLPLSSLSSLGSEELRELLPPGEGPRSSALPLSSLSHLESKEVRELLSLFKVSGVSIFSKIKISTGAAVDYPLYGSPRLRVLFDITGAPSGKSGSGRSLFIEGGSNVWTIGSEWGSFDGTLRERLPFKKLFLRVYQF